MAFFFSVGKMSTFHKQGKVPDYHWISIWLIKTYLGERVKEKGLFFQMTGLTIIVNFPVGSGLKILPQEMIKTVLWNLQG